MNQTLRIIHHRRSTRKYAATPITSEEKDAILQAALRAPTAGNMMLYTIIEVEDQALKDRLSVSCDNQPFIASASYVLLFLADYQRWVEAFNWSDAPRLAMEQGLQPRLPQEGDLLLACCDALIAAQTAVIAAESLGIGSCYIGDIMENYEVHREMFRLPRFTFPVTLLCFGRPYAEREHPGLTRRFGRNIIVHRDHYTPVDADAFPAMLSRAGQQSPDEVDVEAARKMAQGIYTRKFVSAFSVEMTRSVKRWMDIWTGAED